MHKSNPSNVSIHLGGVRILCYSTDLCCNEAQLFEEDSAVYPLPSAAALPSDRGADMTVLNVCQRLCTDASGPARGPLTRVTGDKA